MTDRIDLGTDIEVQAWRFDNPHGARIRRDGTDIIQLVQIDRAAGAFQQQVGSADDGSVAFCHPDRVDDIERIGDDPIEGRHADDQ